MSDAVGVREWRQNLSKYLDRVKAGESLEVTEHGREVARLVPGAGTMPAALARLLARGATMPVPGDLAALIPDVAVLPEGVSIAAIIDEQRADRV